MSTYTRLNLGAIPADTAVHTKCRNCTGRVLVPRVFPWDACGTPTVKIRFGCTQNCKASQ